ncbi:ABC-2 type transport system permease protein [Isoptericola jiangsuensis]|uniref:Transport permease protein n=1 Tax=Isoptericola jiangsuensis TaxID=548579 RepID=A0A2A9F149_9MICO|nr:ABC transporter permease [Isoptericola jiangsuensis]PFG44491.1 ABC-2 type transport system permease protein [Isoptericola jiangsuensis]
MTTTTAPAPWRGFGLLLRTEARVWARDLAAPFFGMLFPTIILLGVGFFIPGMRDPITDAPPSSVWYGLTPIATYLPTVLAMAIGTAALTVMPVTIATYREKGVLRRLSTTPMRPQGIVVSHLIINAVTTVLGVVLALVVAQVVFGVPVPTRTGVVLVAFVLGLTSMFALGMLVAALAPRASAANAVAMSLYFPMLLLAGLWTPGPIMPDLLRQVGQFTPLGAAGQALTTGWFETGFPLVQTVVMIGWTVVLLPIAIRVFRWS